MSKIIDILNVFKNQMPEEYKSYADDVIDSYKKGKIRDNRAGELMSKLFIPTKRPNAIKQIDILKQKTSRKEKIEHEVKFYEKMNKIKNQKQYNISGIISYRIINTDKNNNRVPSSIRTKNVSFITPLMFKSDITKEYIQFGFEDDINIIGQESGTEIEFEPISNININELTSVNLNNIPMGSEKVSIKCLEQSDGINTNPG